MALELFDPTNEENQRERVIVYAQSGQGKSRFAVSLPETPKWGEILLYAADEGSEFLHSVSPERRGRIHVLRPKGDDPIKNFQEFCIHDWKKDFPGVRTLVIDTYTKVAKDTIQWGANHQAVTAEKHFVIGDPLKGGQVIPNRGDYMAIESMSQGYLKNLFQHQVDMNIILICQEDVKVVEGLPQSVGGPSHPGRAMTMDLPAKVSTVIRLVREPYMGPGMKMPEMRVFAVTSHNGTYIAKIRESGAEGNPLAKVMLDVYPVNFWNQYDALFAPKTATQS